MFERYTEAARRALFFSRWETSQVGGAEIEPEHFLLGVLRVGQGPLRQPIAATNFSLSDARAEIAARRGIRDRLPERVEIPFSGGSQRIMRYAAEEADRARHRHIGVEHLVLGILREEESHAAGMLRARGLTLDRLRVIVQESPPDPGIPAGGFDAAEAVERIRWLVEELAQQARDATIARGAVAEIHRTLDELKRRLG